LLKQFIRKLVAYATFIVGQATCLLKQFIRMLEAYATIIVEQATCLFKLPFSVEQAT